MRKFKLSSGIKTAIVILNEIFALLLVVVFIMTAGYGANSGSWDDLLTHRTYEQSEYFKNQSFNQVTRAIRAAARESRFEVDAPPNTSSPKHIPIPKIRQPIIPTVRDSIIPASRTLLSSLRSLSILLSSFGRYFFLMSSTSLCCFAE